MLRGRAYERESVPYKAVDSVIDALSRHLMRQSDEDEEARDLPPDCALSRASSPCCGAFRASRRWTRPNGRRSDSSAAAPSPRCARCWTISVAQPLVIYIDDAQWGDTDSAALLLELVRPPDAPPLLS